MNWFKLAGEHGAGDHGAVEGSGCAGINTKADDATRVRSDDQGRPCHQHFVCLGSDWARFEPASHWAVETESNVMPPRLRAAEDDSLLLHVIAYVHALPVPNQRQVVSINDTVVGSHAWPRPPRGRYCPLPGLGLELGPDRDFGPADNRPERERCLMPRPMKASTGFFGSQDDGHDLSLHGWLAVGATALMLDRPWIWAAEQPDATPEAMR